MAEIEHISIVPEGLTEAGARYVEAVQRLGLRLSFASLAYDIEGKQFRLMIVTNWAERFGSKRIYELLIMAYQAAAVPAEIKPFMVELFAPDTVFAKAVKQDFAKKARRLRVTHAGGGPVKVGEVMIGFGDFGISPEWVFKAEWKKTKTVDELRQFRHFERTIEKLAA